MRYAVIDQNNKVVNVIIWDGQALWRPPLGCVAIACPDETGIGHRYNTFAKTFSAPGAQ